MMAKQQIPRQGRTSPWAGFSETLLKINRLLKKPQGSRGLVATEMSSPEILVQDFDKIRCIDKKNLFFYHYKSSYLHDRIKSLYAGPDPGGGCKI
jgi:hypothetical protein